jgi:hypothetical protein
MVGAPSHTEPQPHPNFPERAVAWDSLTAGRALGSRGDVGSVGTSVRGPSQ